MRYSIGRISLLAGLLALPLGASAQADAEQGASRLERWHPEAFVDPEKPVLQLESTFYRCGSRAKRTPHSRWIHARGHELACPTSAHRDRHLLRWFRCWCCNGRGGRGDWDLFHVRRRNLSPRSCDRGSYRAWLGPDGGRPRRGDCLGSQARQAQARAFDGSGRSEAGPRSMGPCTIAIRILGRSAPSPSMVASRGDWIRASHLMLPTQRSRPNTTSRKPTKLTRNPDTTGTYRHRHVHRSSLEITWFRVAMSTSGQRAGR